MFRDSYELDQILVDYEAERRDSSQQRFNTMVDKKRVKRLVFDEDDGDDILEALD